MTEIEKLQHKLAGLCFTTYHETVQNVLDACGVGSVTVSKIVERIQTSKLGQPLFVYKCAVLFCNDSFEDHLVQPYLFSTPLVIVFTPAHLHINARNKDWKVLEYEDLANNLPLLSPFFDYGFSRRDHYASLALDGLVESLYRELMTENKDSDVCRQVIINILYISFCNHLLNIAEVELILNHDGVDGAHKLKSIYKFFESRNCAFVKSSTRRINLSKEAEIYVMAIMKFDFSQVDMEILSSLIYKMVRHYEVGIYGYRASFVNVLKLLRPLLLDLVQADIDNARDMSELEVIKDRILSIKVFDPTDGPGCYLSATYYGLLEKLRHIDAVCNNKERTQLHINNFISLTGNMLAAELTKMTLLICHAQELCLSRNMTLDQINLIYEKLNVSVADSVLNKDWRELVNPDENLYIIGSPKYAGSHKLSPKQKNEMQTVFENDRLYYADYCSAWLVKSAKFIRGTKAHAAFVLTNSVSQGEQASYIGEAVERNGCGYYLCYRPFKWKLSEASVTVVIIAICDNEKNKDTKKKIYSEGNPPIECDTISPLLLPNEVSVAVKSRRTPLVDYLPPMRKGNMPYQADALEFKSAAELHEFLDKCPVAKPYIRQLMGSEELINGGLRWCLWIRDGEAEDALKLPEIAERVEQVREQRRHCRASDLLKSAPYRFREQCETSKGKITLIVPSVSSENREYIPIGIVDEHVIINNLAFAIYDCELHLLALLESKMHILWAKQCCGKRESRPRYSNELCYNTYPAPHLSTNDKKALADLSRALIGIREKFCDRSLGSLYSKMPPELKNIHQLIDRKVESMYRSRPFESDSERLKFMIMQYKQLTNNG